MADKKNEVAVKQQEALAHSERFTNKVMQEFGGNVAGELQINDYQKQLVQGYFIGIDRALKMAEDKRLIKNKNNSNHDYDNKVAYAWPNVNMNDLALDVVHYARMGLDMMQANHISPIPYLNKKTGKYDVNLMPGYNGIKYIAEKYALDKPVNVITELVYETDTFTPIKKSKDNKVEGYEFTINNAFDRGSIKGGFGYIEFEDPTKNKLIIMSMHDIEKRKPAYAAAEFWGGEITTYEKGKPVKKETGGWLDEMCLKTIKREVYSPKNIPIDPKKIDDNYHYMKRKEAEYAATAVEAEISENANAIPVDFEDVEPVDVDIETGEIKEDAKADEPDVFEQAKIDAAEGPNF